MDLLLIYLCTVNAVGLFLMLLDKRKAVKKRRRIPERVLMGTAVLGGSIGCLAGMYLFRHKTRHIEFTVGIPVLLALQTVGVILIYAHWM